MPLRAIVFDFDGVIANSEPLHLRAYQDVLAAEGIVLTGTDYYARYLGYDDEGAFAAIGADRGRRWSPAEIQRLIARKADQVETLQGGTSILFPRAAETIRRAAAAVPLAIASGALGAEIRRVLGREDLAACFRTIVAAEDAPQSKPAPDPYMQVLTRLRTTIGADLSGRECVAIEDSRWGLQSARAAGLRTVGVAQTYDKSTLIEADLVIDSIGDLDVYELTQLCAS